MFEQQQRNTEHQEDAYPATSTRQPLFTVASNVLAKKKKKKKTGPWYEVWRRLKKNRLAMIGMFVMLAFFVIAVIAPWIIPYDYAQQDTQAILQFPSAEHWFGTDNFGRDIFSRVLYGSRYTLAIGFGCMAATMLISLGLGCAAALIKKLDDILMRIIDIIMSIPTFMLGISIVAALGPGLRNLMLAMTISSVPPFTRVVRAAVLTVCEQEYIEAAISIGANKWRLLFRHILPNSMAPIIIQFTSGAVTVIINAAALSFLGMGIQAPEPEWGAMIAAGRSYLRDYWYMSILPGLAIVLTTFALNIFGDGLRDALDPRLK
jgi:peptide/nickel transport system permease protein